SVVLVCLFFFFSSRRRHTRFSRDWSSDVCSSDLLFPGCCGNRAAQGGNRPHPVSRKGISGRLADTCQAAICAIAATKADTGLHEIGRASCREREYIAGGDG